MYREARAAQVEFEKHQRYLRRFTHGDARAKLGKAGADYLEQVDALLEGLEVKAASGKAVERRKRLAAWVAQQAADGHAIDGPQEIGRGSCRGRVGQYGVTPVVRGPLKKKKKEQN